MVQSRTQTLKFGHGEQNPGLNQESWEETFSPSSGGGAGSPKHVTMGRGPRVRTDAEGDNSEGGAENPPETPSLVTTSRCVSP